MKRGGGGKRNRQKKKKTKNLGASGLRPSMSERNRTISSGCILVKEVGIVLS